MFNDERAPARVAIKEDMPTAALWNLGVELQLPQLQKALKK